MSRSFSTIFVDMSFVVISLMVGNKRFVGDSETLVEACNNEEII